MNNTFWYVSDDLDETSEIIKKNVEPTIQYNKLDIEYPTGYIVTLLPEHGEIQRIILSDSYDGCYRFSDDTEKERFSLICVELNKGIWYATCLPPAFLRNHDGDACRAIRLDNQDFFWLKM